MDSTENFSVGSRVKIFLRIEVYYEGTVISLFPNGMVVEDGNERKLTFVFSVRPDGQRGWFLVPNGHPCDFSPKNENPIHLFREIKLPPGSGRFSFIECTCPELEENKHGHVFDCVEGKNSQHICHPKDARMYFHLMKKSGRILPDDWPSVLNAMKEIREYFDLSGCKKVRA